MTVAALRCGSSGDSNVLIEGPENIAESSHEAFNTITATGYIFGQSELLVFPSRVFILNDSLLLVKDVAEPFIHVVRRRDGSVKQSLGRQGYNTGEFASIRSLVLQEGAKQHFWAYELERRYFTSISLTERYPQTGFGIEVPPLPGDGIVDNPLWISDSLVILSFPTENSSLVLFNPVTAEVRLAAPPISFAHESSDSHKANIPLRDLLIAASEVRLCYEPSRSTLVRVYRVAGRIDLLNINNLDQVVAVSVPHSFLPVFSLDSITRQLSFHARSDQQRVGYVGCVTTPNYFIGLYSGKATGVTKPAMTLADFLHVFEWSGRFIGTIQLNPAVHGIALDRKSLELYGVRYLPDPAIIAFESIGSLLDETISDSSLPN